MREDGYHLLETVFQKILLNDELYFQKAEQTKVVMSHSSGNPIKARHNIIAKSIKLLEHYVGSKLPLQVEVVKKIPMGAGLGGGSSNAATTLQAANQLYDLQLSRDQLQAVGVKIGADVPFLLSEFGCAFARGIGEKIEYLPHLPRYIVGLKPDVDVVTQEAFGLATLQRNIPSRTIDQIAQNLSEIIDGRSAQFFNVFQSCVLKHFPLIWETYRELTHKLSRLALMYPVRLSGSGSTLFVVLPTEKEAQLVYKVWKQQKTAKKQFLFLVKTSE